MSYHDTPQILKANRTYIREAMRIPLLSREQEQKLARAWREKGDEEALHEYGLTLITVPEKGAYDAIILAVAHHQFKDMGVEAIRTLGKTDHVLYDLKYLYPAELTDLRL